MCERSCCGTFTIKKDSNRLYAPNPWELAKGESQGWTGFVTNLHPVDNVVHLVIIPS
jgi:hypothetical protein